MDKFEPIESNKKTIFRQMVESLGCELETLDTSKSMESKLNPEFSQEEILNRWREKFSEQISHYKISDERLQKWARQYASKIQEIINWIKQLSSGERQKYYIDYRINPLSAEFLQIKKKDNEKVVFRIELRMDKPMGRSIEKVYFYTDENLPSIIK